MEELASLGFASQQIGSSLQDFEFLAGLSTFLNKSPNNSDAVDIWKSDGNNESLARVKILMDFDRGIEKRWTVREPLDWLLVYIFNRCHGWKDSNIKDGNIQVIIPSTKIRNRTSSIEEEVRFKDHITEASNDLINWFSNCPISLSLLKSLIYAIRIARGMNHTRFSLMLHTIKWLTRGLSMNRRRNSCQRRMTIFNTRHPSTATPVTSAPPPPPGGGHLVDGQSSDDSVFFGQGLDDVDDDIETLGLAIQNLIFICATDLVQFVRTGTYQPISGLLNVLPTKLALAMLDRILKDIPQQHETAIEALEGLFNVAGLMMIRLVKVNSWTAFDRDTCSPSDSAIEDADSPSTELLAFWASTQLGTVTVPASFPTPFQYMESATFESDYLPSIRSLAFSLSQHPNCNIRKLAGKFYILVLLRVPIGTFETALDEVMNDLCPHPAIDTHVVNGQLFYPGPALPVSTGAVQSIILSYYLQHDVDPVRSAGCDLYIAFDQENMVPNNWVIWRDSRLRIFREICRILVYEQHSNVKASPSPGLDRFNEMKLTSPDDKSRPRRFSYHPRYSTVNVGLTDSSNLGSSKQAIKSTTSQYQYHQMTMLETLRSMDQSSMKSRTGSSSSSGKPSHHSFDLGSRRVSTMMTIKSGIILPVPDVAAEPDNSGQQSLPSRQLDASTGKSAVSVGQSPEGRWHTINRLFLQASIECLFTRSKLLYRNAKMTLAELGRQMYWLDAASIFTWSCQHMSTCHQPSLSTYAAFKLLSTQLSDLIVYAGRLPTNLTQPLTIQTGDRMMTDLSQSSKTVAYVLLSSQTNRSSWMLSCRNLLDLTDQPFQFPTVFGAIASLAIKCILRGLALTNRWPALMADTARLSEQQPVDLKPLFDASVALTAFINQFSLALDDDNRPVLTSQVNLQFVRPHIAFSPPKFNKLEHFLLKLTSTMEEVIFSTIPPGVVRNRIDPPVKHLIGLLLAPCIKVMPTWPLAMLQLVATGSPPLSPLSETTTTGPMTTVARQRVLGVRRLLRIVASIVYALPVNQTSSPPTSSTTLKKDDEVNDQANTLLRQINWLEPGCLSQCLHIPDLTELVNGYFDQLVNVMHGVQSIIHPTPLCKSNRTHWWWTRALAEHVPRLLQVAPLANSNLVIQFLLGQVPPQGKRRSVLWNKALAYGVAEAKRRRLSSTDNKWHQLLDIANSLNQEDSLFARAKSGVGKKSIGGDGIGSLEQPPAAGLGSQALGRKTLMRRRSTMGYLSELSQAATSSATTNATVASTNPANVRRLSTVPQDLIRLGFVDDQSIVDDTLDPFARIQSAVDAELALEEALTDSSSDEEQTNSDELTEAQKVFKKRRSSA